MVLKWTWQECPAHQPLMSQPPTTQRNPPEGRRNRRELLKVCSYNNLAAVI
ncbi:hypothetical protein DPMN_192541 [Dreissena polymorpha]|uniref:Uncharacterized protein n=1 Tax=Dreissena polymorpha TaxID=45954 RepID=A0A9D4BF78_DREPO|nr:hypothetical protein DPMN_192541 [Dreissena polymorpha]